MRGLFAKAVREVRFFTVLLAAALCIFEALLTYILPQLQEQLNETLAQMPFIKTILSALLGTDIGDGITAQMFQAFVWVHPVVLATVWTHLIIHCTRFPAA